MDTVYCVTLYKSIIIVIKRHVCLNSELTVSIGHLLSAALWLEDYCVL